jgi:hypothetical protein
VPGRLILIRFLFAFAIAAISAVSVADTNAPPTFLKPQEVWQVVAAELRALGFSEQQLPRVEDLDMPATLPAVAARSLRISSTCWDAIPRRTQFRVECEAVGQCLPFLVYLRDPAGVDVGARSCRLATESRPALGAHSASGTQPKPVMRPGDRATAVLHSSTLRMTASVTCLEPGREGEVIRVRAVDGHIFPGTDFRSYPVGSFAAVMSSQ